MIGFISTLCRACIPRAGVPLTASRLFRPAALSPLLKSLRRHSTATMAPTVSPFGTWKSPITSEHVVQKSVRFQGIQLDSKTRGADGTVYWAELRPDEGGRVAVCSHKPFASQGDSPVTWTPREHNARTRVHEYGGGSFWVSGGTVYYTNFGDQRLYRQSSPTEAPIPLTTDAKGERYADGFVHPDRHVIYAVRETHTEGEKEARNEICTVDALSGEQATIASGCDFYASPRVSPCGTLIAWVEWDHPNMPWDTTRLCIAKLDASTGFKTALPGHVTVAGGNDVSVMQPSWLPDGSLVYISDYTNWWNLYKIDGAAVAAMQDAGSVKPVALRPEAAEYGQPHWTFAMSTYGVGADGAVLACSKDWIGLVNSKTLEATRVNPGFTSYTSVWMGADGTAYFVAGSPDKFSQVIAHRTATGESRVVRISTPLEIDTAYISVPKHIEFPTTNGRTSHGYFYAPRNKDYSGPSDELPPLLVKVHGGPTAATGDTLAVLMQYWTSRGFAVLDVNYGGSTGYGREYRSRLNGNWGIVDVDDCCNGALYLANEAKEGYTTLAALAFKKVFAAGCSNYGVSDIEALAKDTHKFESRYMDILVGPYPAARDVYLERSPINHIDGITCPIILFQGDEDKIVPPDQSERMFEAVRTKGIPTAYVLFKGEQHGFRNADNIRTALDGEFYFYSRVFKFTPADEASLPSAAITIHNM